MHASPAHARENKKERENGSSTFRPEPDFNHADKSRVNYVMPGRKRQMTKKEYQKKARPRNRNRKKTIRNSFPPPLSGT